MNLKISMNTRNTNNNKNKSKLTKPGPFGMTKEPKDMLILSTRESINKIQYTYKSNKHQQRNKLQNNLYDQ